MSDTELYNWNNLITQTARDSMMTDIRDLINEGHYWKNSPRYQTDVNIFGLEGEHWCNMKMSFIWSVFAYLKSDISIKSIKSWSYMTSLAYTGDDRDNLWHTHTREGSTTVSGVYYLSVPPSVDLKTSGTEFSPLGPQNSQGRFFVPAYEGYWAIWPGSTWHRPGVLQSEKDRFIIAADLEF